MIRRRRPSVVREFLRRRRIEILGAMLASKRKCPRVDHEEREEGEEGVSCVDIDDNADSSAGEDEEEKESGDKEKGDEEEEENEEEDGEEKDSGDKEKGDEEEEENEEEDEEEGEKSHFKLLSAISGLDRQKGRGQRSEATPNVSQFQSSTNGEEVKVGGLLRGVESTGTDIATLRRQLATPTSHQLSPPATTGQVEKTHRAVAYSSACRDVGKWLPVVTHNRKTSHLSFPLQEEAPPLPSLSSRVQDFQAVTELEKAVAGVLGRSEAVVEATDAELTAAEREKLVKVMGEEGRERVREGRRWRTLMSQYEAKCQREKRIKSRRFHKVQRSRRDKVREEGEEEGEGEKAEKLRARERMTLKHSRQGKWAREVLARGRKDPAARAALSEHSQRGQTLKQHHPTPESEGEEEGENNNSSTYFHHDNPWLQSAKPTDEGKMEEQRSNFDPSQHLIEDEEHSEATPPPQLDDITSCQQPKVTSSGVRKEKTGPPMIDPTAYLTPRDEVGGALGVASQQLLMVHEAFAGDDVVGEFAREKREREGEEAGRENFELDVLPGWGSWGGEGVKTKKKKLETSQKTTRKPRSDREPGHVIIGSHGNGKLNKHLVKRLPWPYGTPQQFTRAQATPIGRHWNSEVVHRQMVTPKVETAVGVVIPPLKLTDDVQEFMKNEDSRRGRHTIVQEKTNKQ